jgi:Ca2+-binding RTX toxin-like protein
VSTGVEAFDVDVSEVLFLSRNAQEYAIALNGISGGISVYTVADNGALTLISARNFIDGTRDFTTVQSLLVTLGGSDYVITGMSATDVFAYEIASDGTVAAATALEATSGSSDNVQSIVELSNDGSVAQILVVTETGSIQLRSIAVDGADLVGLSTVDLLTEGDIGHVEVVQGRDQIFVLITDPVTSDLVSYALNDSQDALEEVGRSGASEGIGMGTPTQFVQMTIAGTDYVVVASSQSNSLTVYEIGSDGALLARDHVLDTTYTMFGGANLIETFEVNEVSFFVVAGADAGLDLFTVLPDGQLVLVESLMSSSSFELMDLSSISVNVTDDVTTLYLSSETTQGVTAVAFDTQAWGSVMTGSGGGDTLTGTSAGDVISGFSGNDIIYGGDGADIISDGGGSDILYGGDGADIFVFTEDDATDYIQDFEAGIDQIDLSGFSFFYSISRITTAELSNGIALTVNGERINIYSESGDQLSLSDVVGTALLTPDRPYLGASSATYGTSYGDVILGSSFADTIDGLEGADTITGEDGADIIEGGTGDDVVYGGDGNDTISGSDGADRLIGDAGDDFVEGGDGADFMGGGDGNDIVNGDAGGDRIYGGSGDDTLDGGDGWDRLYGQDGDDILLGGQGVDYIYGGTGTDTVDGGSEADIISGNEGGDVLSGGAGGDRIYGNEDDDTIMGDEGWDRLYGQDGDDIISGGDGSDYLYGAAGSDRLSGDDGTDVLLGGDDADYLFGGSGGDLLYGEDGADTLSGEDGDDVLSGGGWADRLYGGAGNDQISGDDGWDWLSGQDGNDALYGGDGNDTLYGGNGDDEIDGGEGDDALSGNDGNDSFIFVDAFGYDTIQDFNHSEDLIVFDIDGFTQSDLAVSQNSSGFLVLALEIAAVTHTILVNDVGFEDYSEVEIVFL